MLGTTGGYGGSYDPCRVEIESKSGTSAWSTPQSVDVVGGDGSHQGDIVTLFEPASATPPVVSVRVNVKAAGDRSSDGTGSGINCKVGGLLAYGTDAGATLAQTTGAPTPTLAPLRPLMRTTAVWRPDDGNGTAATAKP